GREGTEEPDHAGRRVREMPEPNPLKTRTHREPQCASRRSMDDLFVAEGGELEMGTVSVLSAGHRQGIYGWPFALPFRS
ncbi:MAG: hypothetical protein ACR2KW_02130, partial [Rubrobacter sp.]